MGITEEVQGMKDKISELTKLITTYISPGETPSEFEPIIAEIREVKEAIDNMQLSYDEKVLSQALADFGNTLQELKELINSGDNLRLELIRDELMELKEEIKKSTECRPTISEQMFSDEESSSDKAFNRRRDFALLSCMLLAAIASILTAGKYSWGFSISFGFLMSFGVLNVGVMVLDRFVLPGQTIKRISHNAVAISILLTGFFGLFIAGAAIGNSIITHNDPTEESTKGYSKQIGIYQESTESDTGSGKPIPVQQFNTSESSKEN